MPVCVLALGVLATAFDAPPGSCTARCASPAQRRSWPSSRWSASRSRSRSAAAGLDYWALVIGSWSGTTAMAVGRVLASPYPLRLHFDRAALHGYFRFGWPLLVGQRSGLRGRPDGHRSSARTTAGLAGLGAIGLVGSIIAFADRVDQILTQTLYPAVCAVRDRIDLLYESFSKSNRLALIWGMPFGFGLALFAQDIVALRPRQKWEVAVGPAAGLRRDGRLQAGRLQLDRVLPRAGPDPPAGGQRRARPWPPSWWSGSPGCSCTG